MMVFFFLNSVNEETHMALSHQNYKAGNFKQALEHGTAVYKKNPQRTDNLLLLGAIYYQVGFICILWKCFCNRLNLHSWNMVVECSILIGFVFYFDALNL